MELNKDQTELAAKYFAASNTGLLGCGFDKPTNKGEVRTTFSQISYEYENETGEGLEEELEWWIKKLKNKKDYDYYLDRLKEDAPFILEP